MTYIQFICPRCANGSGVELTHETDRLTCPNCDWEQLQSVSTAACPVCGCDDMWRQKNFSQALGLTMVALAAGLSTIAWWYYEPVWALGILLFFALIDWVLYMVMPDVLVCYRCRSRISGLPEEAEVPKFNLEVQERYRQEAIRKNSMVP